MRLIVNHPVKAYMEIGVDVLGAMNINSETMLLCVKGIIAGAIVILKNAWLFADCLMYALRDIIFLAFYPLTKLYFILGARREIMRNHPEYKQPRRKEQMR